MLLYGEKVDVDLYDYQQDSISIQDCDIIYYKQLIELCFNNNATAPLITSFARSISGYELPKLKSIQGMWKLENPTPTIEGIKLNLQLMLGEWIDVISGIIGLAACPPNHFVTTVIPLINLSNDTIELSEVTKHF